MEFSSLLTDFLRRYPSLCGVRESLCAAYDALVDCYTNDGKVLVCGNGGSAADSEHIVGELMKGFQKKRPLSPVQRDCFANLPDGALLAASLQNALPAISLVSQTGLSTAFANDVDADLIFAQQVWGYGKSGDVLIALSTSGNSKNTALAASAAKALGVTVLAITGLHESKLSAIADICLRLPAATPRDVQELTLPVYHFLCEATEARFFSE